MAASDTKKGKTPKEKTSSAKDAEDIEIKAGGWKEMDTLKRRRFCGAKAPTIPLRVSMEREAYAELTAHAKDDLEREVAGVLVGGKYEDEEGVFVHIQAIIRGDSVRQGETHVTYTQETWSAIHRQMDENYPSLAIVGWYHSHPGFGVEFSDMDLFIHQNFFSGQGQLALVTDPLGGDLALCATLENGPTLLDRFWVGGREQRLRMPSETAGAEGGAEMRNERMERLEERVVQLTHALDDLRGSLRTFLLSIGVLIMLAILSLWGYAMYQGYTAPLKPPEMKTKVDIPLMIDGEKVLLTIGIYGYVIPPTLQAKLMESLLREMEAQLKAMQIQQEKSWWDRIWGSSDTADPPKRVKAPHTPIIVLPPTP